MAVCPTPTIHPTDHAGMEILDSSECLQLLRSRPIGRIAYVEDGAPRIFPVTFGVSADRIVFRSGLGSKLDAAEMGRRVAFQVDEWDMATRCGWSVMITGRGRPVSDRQRLAEIAELDLEPWLEGDEMEWVEITIEEMTGRRLPPTPH